MAGETNADQGANNAPGGSGAPNGGGQGSQQSTQARGPSDDGGRADPKAAGSTPAGTHSEPNADDLATLKAEITKLKALNERLEVERKEAVARRKAAKAEAEGTKTEAERIAEEAKAAVEAKYSAELRSRDVLDAVIDKNPANPKLLRMLIRGSGIDITAADTKATMDAIDKLLDDETLAPIKGTGVPDVPGSGSGGRTAKIGTYHPISGKRLL
jgi:hypothetical protein